LPSFSGSSSPGRVELCDFEDESGNSVTLYQTTPRNITSSNNLIILHKHWVVVTLTDNITKRMSERIHYFHNPGAQSINITLLSYDMEVQ
jgi:hypothetical protein